jgi:hypothetical protein
MNLAEPATRSPAVIHRSTVGSSHHSSIVASGSGSGSIASRPTQSAGQQPFLHALGGVRSVLREPGQPIDPRARHGLEARIGHDLSRIRIHADGGAGSTARQLGAAAYAVGQHIVFAPGRYSLYTSGGRRLLAHEIAHTIQQPDADPTSEGLRVSDVDDPREIEAMSAASDIASGWALNTSPAIRPGARSARTAQRTEPTLFRAVETACLAPSEIPGIGDVQSSRLGQILEVPIMTAYCRDTGCAPFATDFFDAGDAASYIAFLNAHNPHLSTADIIELTIAATVTGGLSRPDILTHRPPRLEFEEIKPDSTSGRAAGRVKLAALDVLFTRFALPYAPGITWPGAGRIRMLVLPGPVDVFLEWHRLRTGLVVYNICVEGERSVLLAYGIVALMLAIIAIILSRGRVIIPAPVLAEADLPPRSPEGPGTAQPMNAVPTTPEVAVA